MVLTYELPPKPMQSRTREKMKQVVCFIEPSLNQLAYEYVLEAAISRQALLAKSLNIALMHYGSALRLSSRVYRLVRPRKRRKLRENAYGRTGKSALSGWYDKCDVDAAMDALARKDISLQDAIEFGLKKLLLEGSEPEEEKPGASDVAEGDVGEASGHPQWSGRIPTPEEDFPEF